MIDALQRIDDTLFYAFALHDGRKQSDLELQTVRVVGQLVAEIAIACCCFAADDSDALTEQRQL